MDEILGREEAEKAIKDAMVGHHFLSCLLEGKTCTVLLMHPRFSCIHVPVLDDATEGLQCLPGSPACGKSGKPPF